MKTKSFLLILGILLWLSDLSAQGVNFYSTDPVVFIQEFTQELNQNGQEKGREASETLATLWSGGNMTAADQEAFIQLINIMVSKRMPTSPDLANFSLSYAKLVQGSTFVRIPYTSFMEVTQKCVFELEPKRTGKYLQIMNGYLDSGYPIKKNRFSWYASQNNPDIKFEQIQGQEGEYEAPVIVYSNTDLFYESSRYKDSSLIKETSGKFYPLSMVFLGNSGKVTWEKVGLPESEAFVELGDYRLNLNYGLIKADTATLTYTELLERPLVGKFEDRNIGFKDVKKANYPYFQSHEGGVVIENFVPNVRYEGGFSLKGIRTIGTGYDIVTTPPEEESNSITGSFLYENEYLDNTYSDDSWDNVASEQGSFESDESWAVEDEEWTTGGSYDDPVWGSDPLTQIEHVPAKIEVQRQGQVVMALEGEAFILDTEKMVGKELKATVYTSAEDTIYHPQMDILYAASDSTVILKKPKKSAFRQVPFTSSYHEYFLYFETIKWDLRTNQLEFTAFIDREHKVAAIESFDYFTKSRFNQYKGILKFNPIGAIYRYSETYPDRPIFASDIMAKYKMSSELASLERALPKLQGAGFITYDPKSMQIFPLPKLYNWARAARKKKDFDAIQIISKVDTGSHATLNLEDMAIEMRGVDVFSMSDSVFVRVVPANKSVVIEENRNLKFGGLVAAGRLNFYGNDSLQSFMFDYESYKIVCDSLDSIRFVLVRNPVPGQEEDPLKKALSNTVFEGVSGAIHIDHPGNKSGEKDYSFFPVFDSYSSSYLYWASPDIEGGVYEKEKMHFAVDPFVLDSLEDFDPNNLQFDGEFYSSEIFPSFRQRLQVMDDYTLGFAKIVEEDERFRIYEGNGSFTGEVSLDKSGLHGDGTINYLGTIAKSDTFRFHFDSVMAKVQDFKLEPGRRGGVYFPQVDAENALYTWYTKDSTLEVSSQYENLSLFDGEGEFTGTLFISDKGMVGDGVMKLGAVEVAGDSIVFNQMDFKAEKSDFIVVDELDEEVTHFIAKNVNINYNVEDHISTFDPVSEERQTADFPIHQFATSLAKGTYTRETKELVLDEISPYREENYFISTDPAQEKLRFTGRTASYVTDNKEIVIDSVDKVLVADAVVTPDQNRVTVGDDGYLKPLMNATIEADQENKMHRIYEAVVQVNSKNDYTGSGKYDYIEVNGQEQYIEFNDIKVNSDTTTIASGEITEEDEFYLTERIFFRGNARLDASRKFLEFEGEVKIESENEVFRGAWFIFDNAIVNPDSVFIPIADDLTNALGEPLTVGLNFYPEGRSFYSTFLQPKDDENDLEILSASGGLTFDRTRKEFKIGSREKLQGQVFKGSTVAFNDEANTITSSGFLKFPYDFYDKTINMKMAGSWKEDMRARQLTTDLIVGLNMSVIPEEALEELANTIAYITATSGDIDFNQRSFLEGASELLDEGKEGERETQKLVENVRNSMVYTDIKMAQQLPFTLLLSGANFNYDRRLKSLYSDAEVGLIGVGGKSINKTVNAKIVYRFGSISAEGEKLPDKVTVYLEIDEFNWVYFHFEEDVVFTTSSYYDEYNARIQEAVDKRKNNEGFRVELATDEDRTQFLQDFIIRFIR